MKYRRYTSHKKNLVSLSLDATGEYEVYVEEVQSLLIKTLVAEIHNKSLERQIQRSNSLPESINKYTQVNIINLLKDNIEKQSEDKIEKQLKNPIEKLFSN